MKLKSGLLVIGLLFGLQFSSTAQESVLNDYLVSVKGDTLKCMLKKVFLSSKMKYRTDTTSKYSDVDPSQFIKYHRQGEEYTNKLAILDEKLRYLPIIEEGKINLFEKITVSYNPQTHLSQSKYDWYVAKGTDTLTHLKTNGLLALKSRKERKSELVQMLADNPAVLEQFYKDESFTFKELRDIIHLYNTGERLKKD